jgi:predicted SAM-dependent methyltransferase
MTNQIYNRRYVWRWTYLFKFELASLIGRTFFSRQPHPKSKLLHLGCGNIYLDEFVNADFYYLRWVPFRKQPGKYDWLADFRYTLNCPDNYWEGVFSEHTIEHFHYSDCLQLFKELYRTMQQGAWLRICVPGLEEVLSGIDSKQTKAIAIYNLTQNHGHVSVWDSALMTMVLRDAGFMTIHKTNYMQGSDPRLLQDSPGKSPGSLYMEAQK